MKKFILSVFAVLFALSVVNAQDFKAQKGNVTADLGLFEGGILSNNSPVSLNNGMLKGRYFLSNELALRGALYTQNRSTTEYPSTDITTKSYIKSLALSVGIEKHFAGTDRLSPYVGADLGISSSGTGEKTINAADNSKNTETKGRGSFGINGNLFFGADYYIARHLYLGVEAGLALTNTSTGKGSTTANGTTTYSQKGPSIFSLKADAFGGFKLGFVF